MPVSWSRVLNNWAKYVGFLKYLNSVFLVVKIHEAVNKRKLPLPAFGRGVFFLALKLQDSYSAHLLRRKWESSEQAEVFLSSFWGVELSKTSKMLRQFRLANGTEDKSIHYSIHLTGNRPAPLEPSQKPLKRKYYLPNTGLEKKHLCPTKRFDWLV